MKTKTNNIDAVRASLARSDVIRKAIRRENETKKKDELEKKELPIHPGQTRMHLFPVFKAKVSSI